MKKIVQIIFSAIVIALFAFSTSAQAALGVSVGAQSSGNTQAGGDRNGTRVEGQGNLDVSISGSKDDQSENTSSSDDSNTTVTSSTQEESDASVAVGSVMVVRSKAMKETAMPMKDPSTVSNRSDLESFITASAQNDENFQSASSSNDEVSLRYKEPAKLFGFLPISLSTNVKADANGNVKVHYPWYRFLVALQDSDLQSKIEAKVNAVLLANGAKDTSAEFSASTQAHLINDIREALHESYQNIKNPNAKANADVNASASGTYESGNLDAQNETDASANAAR